jgi:4-hydroxybenzoyl-CoA thioesterase
MEDWFNEGLGGDYADFVVARGMGLPIVKTECEFLAPNLMGDILELELVVKRLGTSSITLGVRGIAKGRECVRATFTVVHTKLGAMQSMPIPEPLRSAMARFEA